MCVVQSLFPVEQPKKVEFKHSVPMAADFIVRFVGCLNLTIFFVADFLFAYVLHRLKQDHPSIDECAPQDGDDIDTVTIITSAINELDHLNQSTGAGAKRTTTSGGTTTAATDRGLLIHRIVIAASFCAPFFSFLQIIVPHALEWSMFNVPSWLGYLSIIPGLGVALFYASRAIRVSSFHEVSKSQWLSMMWFRLDTMCVMAVVMLLGWGDWLVALCLLAVALYLAHRLLVTEKRLASATKGTQLLREEMDLERLVVEPNGTSDERRGYSAVRSS